MNRRGWQATVHGIAKSQTDWATFTFSNKVPREEICKLGNVSKICFTNHG